MEEETPPGELGKPKEKLPYRPKISVVIPVLNKAHEVPQLLQSLKQQTYQGEVEVIVADAGSIDGTIEVCKKAGINVVAAPKERGIGATRRAGCESATGEILVNTDSDCLLPPNYLKSVVKTFADPEVIASYGPTEYTYQGRPAKGLIQKLIQLSLGADRKKRHRRGQPMLCGPNFAILRSVYKALGGFDTRTQRIEEPVLCQLLWQMPGVIAFVGDQKVQTELPWQEGGKPSRRQLQAYRQKNRPWIPVAHEVIRERRKKLSAMQQKVQEIIQERKAVQEQD